MNIQLKTKFTIILSVLILLGITGIGLLGYSYVKDSYIEHQEFVNLEKINQTNSSVETIVEGATSDLKFLGQFYALNRYLIWKNLGVRNKTEKWQGIVEDSMKSFIEARKRYYKIRFMDLKGNELIGIEYDKENDRAYSLPENMLQNRAGADYFTNTAELNEEEYYVSKINLNRDYGKITIPYLPVLRFAMPVFDKNGVKYGIIVINLFADTILNELEEETKHLQEEYQSLFLVGKDGTYLYHKDKSKRFNKDLKHGESFKKDFPEVFKLGNSKEEGTTVLDNTIFTYKKIYLDKSKTGRYVIAVSATDRDFALKDLTSFNYIFFISLTITLALIFYVINYLMNTLINPIALVTKSLKSLSQGEFAKEKISYEGHDEISEMISSMKDLESNTMKIVHHAKTIAGGDFDKELAIRSRYDVLSKSLNEMTVNLKRSSIESSRRMWIQKGMNSLSSKISGDLEIEEMTREALSFVSTYLEAGQGALYIFDKDLKNLTLNATYAFNERTALSNIYKLGEGTVGQVGLEKKPILLKNIKREEKTITTGVVDEAPLNTYTFPLIYENELYGVVELASFVEFDNLKTEFLNEASESIATYLYATIKNSEIVKLLKKAEEATAEAQKKTEEVQEVNTQMEEQQQQLQQQSEELQQANTQMEEQQQQVQLQANELKIKNEDLMAQQKELESSNQYKSEFLANMSHELRTPLNSIILLSKLLSHNEKSQMSEEEIKRANVINGAGNELLRLINDILDISKIEAGHMIVNKDRVPTKDIGESMVDLFESTAVEKGVKFNIVDKLKQEIVTDKDKLFQILRNFLSNSFKFTKKGSVSLEFLKNDDENLPIKINVKDTGIGIPKDKQDEIFEAFRQVDGSITREFGGTGLGLSIALQFTELLGGEIELESDVGKGSCFSILMPEQSIDDEAEEKTEETPSRKGKRVKVDDIGKHDKKTVLIIEDDNNFAGIVAEEARKLNFNSFIANNGDEGLKILNEKRPNGIIIDLDLPDINGIELLRELKSTKEFARIPAYIMSGKERDKESEDSSIVGYLQKPISLSDIQKAIVDIEKRVDSFTTLKKEGGGYIEKPKSNVQNNNLKDKNILVVDDDVKNIFVLSSALEEQGAKVVDALNGKKALEVLKKTKVDLILMDVMMPEMDGYEAIKIIREDEKLKSIPIISLTAKALKEDKEKCMAAGANDYISKPVDYDTLIRLSSVWSSKKV